MKVYVLQLKAVYYQGVIAVASTEDEARTLAAEASKQGDGHHDIVILPIKTDIMHKLPTHGPFGHSAVSDIYTIDRPEDQ